MTWADPNRGLLVLQDNQDAATLHLDFQPTTIKPGQRIRVESEDAAVFVKAFPEFPFKPARSEWLPNFSAPTNSGNAYLARMHGFLIPPTTGDYVFYITSKGSSDLWLATNGEVTSLSRVAFVADGKAADPGQWDKFPSQMSSSIRLDGGKPYLFDVLQEQRGGRDDTVTVAWQRPGMRRAVIDGSFLVPCSDRKTNGVVRDFWNDYLLASLCPLTTGRVEDSELAVANPRITILGQSPYPDPLSVELGAALLPAQNFRWSEVDGVVEFAAFGANNLDLTLAKSRERVRLKLPGNMNLNPADLVGMRVVAKGVCEQAIDADGKRTAGTIWVPSEKEFSEVGFDPGNFNQLKSFSIGDLDPANPALAAGRRVRIRGTVLRNEARRLVVQGSARICGYVSTNGTAWKSVAPAVDVLMHGSALGGLLVSSFRSGGLTTAQFDSVSGVDSLAQDAEIADAAPPGKTQIQTGGEFAVRGGGTGFGSSFERFHFFSEALTDETEISARLTAVKSSEIEATAGIMMRDSTDPFSSFSSLTMNAGGGVAFHFRQSAGERDEGISLDTCAFPCWLKLTRSFPTVQVHAEEDLSARVGDTVDLVGSLKWNGNQALLVNVRRLDNSVAAGSPASPAENADEAVAVNISQMVPERDGDLREGSGSIIVRGVVTFTGQAFGRNYLIVQDQSAGIAVRLNARFLRRAPALGQLVELETRSQNGRWPFPPDPNRMQVIGPGRLPEPLSLTAANSQLRGGEFSWVETQGIIREATAGEGMKLITQSGEMPVWLGERPDAGTNRLVDALVRVRGVLIYRDGRASLLAPSWANVEVLESAPANPFSIPTIAIDRLSEFSRHASSCHRVKIAGVVTCRNYKLFVVQDDSGGVEVETSNPGEVLVRDAVEVVGFADGPPGSIALSQAAVRKVGIAPMPAAVPISAEQLYSGDYDARVVRLDGVLLAQNIAGGNQVLELQSEQRVCRAELPNSRSRLNSIPVGSQVRVTGVSLSDHLGNSLSVGASGQSAASFGILLRGPEDVVILQWPPWWAWKHATLVIGTLV